MDSIQNAGLKQTFPMLNISNEDESSQITQHDIFSQSSEDDVLRIETLNQLEHFRTTMEAAYLDEQTALMDKSIALESQKIEKLKEYRQSLISNVVTGKICVA